MEVPEQKLPLVFSQMLQMFPHIPHDVIWMYVQRYSNDIEKCAQMLNLQSGNYSNQQSSPVILDNKNVPDINNEIKTAEQSSLLYNPANDSAEKNINDSQTSMFHNQQSVLNVQSTDVSNHSSDCDNNSSTDFSKATTNSINCQEPLTLQIGVEEDEDSVHSWRPNLSVGSLYSDLFLPSPMFEDFQLSSSQISNLNAGYFIPKSEVNQEIFKLDLQRYSENSTDLLHGYPSQCDQFYDISSHLNFQRSHMNSIRYEVIKAKIELNDINESIEKLSNELEERLKLRNAQDLGTLRDEVIQLRLECQCLCTEVDFYSKDRVLLGEVDESNYNGERRVPTESQNPTNGDCSLVGHLEHGSSDKDESDMWKCPKCTFDNHPAINACEMCHLPRPRLRKPSLMLTPPDTCYCHPKKESLSVQS